MEIGIWMQPSIYCISAFDGVQSTSSKQSLEQPCTEQGRSWGWDNSGLPCELLAEAVMLVVNTWVCTQIHTVGWPMKVVSIGSSVCKIWPLQSFAGSSWDVLKECAQSSPTFHINPASKLCKVDYAMKYYGNLLSFHAASESCAWIELASSCLMAFKTGICCCCLVL